MKRIAAIFLFVACFSLVKAQEVFNLGLKVGINTSKISTRVSYYTPHTINNYLVGAFVRLNAGRIYLQPEAYYNSKGGEYIDKLNSNTIDKFNLHTIDVPLLAGLKIINRKALNLRIMAGPFFSFATDKSVSGQLSEDHVKNSFLGWQYGAGADFLFLTLDARFESLNNNLYSTPDMGSKNGIFLLSLGIKLF
jgi:hypothetical protein